MADVLSGTLEPGQPVTGRAATARMKSIPDQAQEPEQRIDKEDCQASNTTLLDLLEDYPNATPTLGQYPSFVTPMRMRQYRISSTPLTHPD